MADTPKPGDTRHKQARALAERALGHYGKGDRRTGDDLAGQATTMDREAVIELAEEIEADPPHAPTESLKR